MENTVSETDALLWRVARLQEQNDLHYKNTSFWVDFLLPWVNVFLPWVICFCREQIPFPVSDLLLPWQLTYSDNVHVNTIAKGNPVKAVREGSMIFRFERPTSRKSAKCNRNTRHFWCHRINIGSRYRVSMTCVNMDWTLDWQTGIWIALWTLD